MRSGALLDWLGSGKGVEQALSHVTWLPYKRPPNLVPVPNLKIRLEQTLPIYSARILLLSQRDS